MYGPELAAEDFPADTHYPGSIVTCYPEFRLRLPNGRVRTFSWHRQLGPTFLRADGEPFKVYPTSRNRVWKLYEAWEKHGRRVDALGFCILEPAE